MPRVATKPCTLSTVTKTPLAAPIAAVTASVSSTAGRTIPSLPSMVWAAIRLARLIT